MICNSFKVLNTLCVARFLRSSFRKNSFLKNKVRMALVYTLCLHSGFFFAQEEEYSDEAAFYDVAKDPTPEGQWAFVQELLYTAGFMPDKVEIYQTLPNNARVYRVTLDSVTGGFLFVRWDKKKQEHYIANKMINPGWYYNLKAAREIMRKQTNQATFSKEDVALQAADQTSISADELNELRSLYSEKQFVKDSLAEEERKYTQERLLKKQERKEKKTD